MEKFFTTMILSVGFMSYGQVGMNIKDPRGALDINNNDTTNTMGLVLPTNSDVTTLINPQGGNVVPGTIVYDSTQDCVKYYRKTEQWSNCIRFSTSNIRKITDNNFSKKDSKSQR